ncbi:PfkB family carbohydrate kinase [Flavobacterium sp. RHBU_3]|uniref:PfkB family carbohydrate kinase n=1 Tax=Flavobacterium sp. RHBU_3 TaxID=3391184 RepID=UPI00398529D8
MKMTHYKARNKVITIGEVYMMATSKGHFRVTQPMTLDFSVKGCEMNVAASLSSLGQDVSHFTIISDDTLGETVLDFMKHRSINTQYVQKTTIPLCICLVEKSVDKAPVKVANSITKSPLETFDWSAVSWKNVFQDAGWLFWSASFVRLQDAAGRLAEILQSAQADTISVVTDLSLVNPGITDFSRDIVTSLIPYSSVVIANVENINMLLETDFGDDTLAFTAACTKLNELYPNITSVFDKVCNGSRCYGRGWVNKRYIQTPEIDIGCIVDDEGTSESFAAGLLYILRFHEEQHALNFAIAAFALQHTVKGDYNEATVNEIIAVLQASRRFQ